MIKLNKYIEGLNIATYGQAYWRVSKSNFMSGALAEYKTSFHRSYPCVVFLSAKKPMRVVNVGTSFINCGRLDFGINQHRTPGREKTYVNLRGTGMSMTNTLKNCLISFRKIVI